MCLGGRVARSYGGTPGPNGSKCRSEDGRRTDGQLAEAVSLESESEGEAPSHPGLSRVVLIAMIRDLQEDRCLRRGTLSDDCLWLGRTRGY